jgi:hypothetical protein
MEAAVSEAEKDGFFRKESKIGLIVLLACLALLGLTSLMWIWMGFAARDGDMVSVVTESFLGAMFAAFSATAFFSALVETKRTAVKQCLAVAEKFELDLTKWQVYELATKWSAMGVFKLFVAFVQQTKPELIPAGTFISTGGKLTATACRKLVEHLWQVGELESVAGAKA